MHTLNLVFYLPHLDLAKRIVQTAPQSRNATFLAGSLYDYYYYKNLLIEENVQFLKLFNYSLSDNKSLDFFPIFKESIEFFRLKETQRSLYFQKVISAIKHWQDELHALFSKSNTLLFVWNGNKFLEKILVQMARTCEAKVVFLEEGFSRPRSMAIDSQGIGVQSHFMRTLPSLSILAKEHDKPSKNLPLLPSPPFYKLYKIFDRLPFFTVKSFQNIPTIRRELVYRFCKCLPKSSPIPNPQSLNILVALQLPYDSQIFLHSPISNQWELNQALEDVLKNIQNLTKKKIQVFIKPHPKSHESYFFQFNNIQTTPINRTTPIEKCLPSMDLIITINSTVGLEALRLGKKVIILGRSIYEHLCFQYSQTSNTKLKEYLTSQVDRKAVELFDRKLQQNYQIPINTGCFTPQNASIFWLRLKHLGLL